LEHLLLSFVEEIDSMPKAKSVDTREYAEDRDRDTCEAFDHILSSGLPSLYRGAYRLLGNAADAEDAVQEALLAAYTHLDQFRGQAKMSTWLSAIVHNSARMQLRRRLRHAHVSLDEQVGEVAEHLLSQRLADRRPGPEDQYRNIELGRRLAHFQAQLTPALRRAFQFRETAEILGVPHGTVKAQLARARKRLKNSMRRTLRSPICTLTYRPRETPCQGHRHEVDQMDCFLFV
jgi:RNA polymerase sigma-70 factor, ECF subfamily